VRFNILNTIHKRFINRIPMPFSLLLLVAIRQPPINKFKANRTAIFTSFFIFQVMQNAVRFRVGIKHTGKNRLCLLISVNRHWFKFRSDFVSVCGTVSGGLFVAPLRRRWTLVFKFSLAS
jgi:hypothetical protein